MIKRCIYCNDNLDLSVSDIIPDSITNTKCTNNNVCKKHNSMTNNLFENKFALDFKFIRNRLGFRERFSSKKVSYRANIKIKDPSYKKEYNTRKIMRDVEGLIKGLYEFDRNGKVKKVKNINPIYSNVLDPIIEYGFEINYNELFLSKSTLKTVTKIAFEWHCKISNINSFNNRYSNIIDALLNDGELSVNIINEEDVNYIENIFGYVFGSHALLEYVDKGNRHVIFSLFGIVWYDVLICEDFNSELELEMLYIYRLDKVLDKNKSNAILYDINNSEYELNHHFFIPNYTEPKNVSEVSFKIWSEKTNELLNTINLTKENIKLLINEIEQDNYYNRDLYYYSDIINYQMNRKMSIMILLSIISEMGYDKSIIFIENTKNWNNTFSNIEDFRNYWINKIINDNLNYFKKEISKGIKVLKDNI